MSPSVIAFYAAVATIVPVLFLAFAFQLGVRRLWQLEEPIYRAIFPVYVGVHGCLAIAAEGAALSALITESDSDLSRALSWLGIIIPMLYLVIGLVFEARELHADFSWDDAFRESREQSQRLDAARERRRAEFRARLEAVRHSPDLRLGSPLGTIERLIYWVFAAGIAVATIVGWVQDGWSTSTASMLVLSVLLTGTVLFFELILPWWLVRYQRRASSASDDKPPAE